MKHDIAFMKHLKPVELFLALGLATSTVACTSANNPEGGTPTETAPVEETAPPTTDEGAETTSSPSPDTESTSDEGGEEGEEGEGEATTTPSPEAEPASDEGGEGGEG